MSDDSSAAKVFGPEGSKRRRLENPIEEQELQKKDKAAQEEREELQKKNKVAQEERELQKQRELQKIAKAVKEEWELQKKQVDDLKELEKAVSELSASSPQMVQNCVVYKYINQSLRLNAILVMCDNKIYYASGKNYSGWHGEVVAEPGPQNLPMMTLRFDCQGRADRLKPTCVCQVASEDGQQKFEGWDYAARPIILRKLGELVWLPQDNVWQALSVTTTSSTETLALGTETVSTVSADTDVIG